MSINRETRKVHECKHDDDDDDDDDDVDDDDDDEHRASSSELDKLIMKVLNK